MAEMVRAIYRDGQLQLLDPVDLEDGQTVSLTINPETELSPDDVETRLRAAGLLETIDVPDDWEELKPAERQRIGRLFVGERPSEDLIDEDRGLY
jgi:predicted DNA-binding antitoxin AbrB/MazE fold protein